MKFKWLRAKNFLSIGEKGIFIQFDKLGEIVLIKGKNLDVSPDSSNGAGKSTIIQCITYVIFGKLVKDLPQTQVINKKTKKCLEMELCFEMDGSEYVIRRGRKPDHLKLLRGGKDETVGGMPDTQRAIDKIVKLNYESFVNVVCFGEHNNHAFLSCDAATKRSIVESLLGLEKYIKYCKAAKEGLKEVEGLLGVVKKKYETAVDQRGLAASRLAQIESKRGAWKAAKVKEAEDLKSAISSKTAELHSTDDGRAILLYKEAVARVDKYKDDMVKLEENRKNISSVLEQIRPRLDEIQNEKNSLSLELKTKEGEVASKRREVALVRGQISAMQKLQPGVKCGACFGTVDPRNYQPLVEHNSRLAERIESEISSLEAERVSSSDKLKVCIAEFEKISGLKRQAEEKNNSMNFKLNEILKGIQRDSAVKEPSAGSRELLLKEQIAELNRRLESKKNELECQDPYSEIYDQTAKEKDDLEASISDLSFKIGAYESKLPYYEFWIHGFGDDGIRAFVIDGILPTLNSKINYWLQFLIDNKITLSFDNKFDPVIERNPPDGDPFVYNATSGGEKRRINLAISQAFAHVMIANSGTDPSLISLDEVALNVDVPGVHGIYKMICELAKDRQVFVTTHEPNLNDLLNSCEVLTVVKKDGFSEIV